MLKPFMVTGIIELVLFSFIVQLPRGIMACTKLKSFACKWWMYRSISVSEWCLLNTGCERYADVLDKLSGMDDTSGVDIPGMETGVDGWLLSRKCKAWLNM